MSAPVLEFRHELCQVCERPNPAGRVRTCSGPCHAQWMAREAKRELWRRTVHTGLRAIIRHRRRS